VRTIGFLFGTAFGFLIALAGLNNYEVIHNMLLLDDLQPFWIMGSAMVVALGITFVLERRAWVTPLGGVMKLGRSSIQRHHITGAAIFGTGWALAGTCPAPALAMGASGALFGFVVAGGLFAGLHARALVEEARKEESMTDLDIGHRAPAPGDSLPGIT
jgi:uncharacterized membrane protein YedE/YeeE